MPETKVDRVELGGGIWHLPAELRDVARRANEAGLEGWKLVDAEVGIDIDGYRSDPNDWGSRVLLVYEKENTDAKR